MKEYVQKISIEGLSYLTMPGYMNSTHPVRGTSSYSLRGQLKSPTE